MMLDNSLYNEHMLAHELGMRHTEIMLMTNTEYLNWFAYFKRRDAETPS